MGIIPSTDVPINVLSAASSRLKTNISRCATVCSFFLILTLHAQYLKLKKPTGSGVCPPEVKRAHALEARINERAGTRDVSDFDLNDSTSGESSDDDVEVIDDPTIHTAVARRAPTPPLRRSRKSAPDLIDKLSRAFDPAAQRARDEERYHRSAENTQVFTLSQQLRDAHTSAETLRNQISILQQHLNDAERARDVALLKVDMMDRRTEKADRWTRGRNSRSRSPRRRSPSPRKIRCEARYPDGGACTYWVTDASESEKENGERHRRSPLPQRTQIFYKPRSPHRRSPSPGPSNWADRYRTQRSPSPPRPITPLMRSSTVHDESASLVTGNSGVELTVTPNRAGAAPVSLIISAPQMQNGPSER